MGRPGVNGQGLARGTVVPRHRSSENSSFAPTMRAPFSGSRVMDGSFCLFFGKRRPWSKSTRLFDPAVGPLCALTGGSLTRTSVTTNRNTVPSFRIITATSPSAGRLREHARFRQFRRRPPGGPPALSVAQVRSHNAVEIVDVERLRDVRDGADRSSPLFGVTGGAEG